MTAQDLDTAKKGMRAAVRKGLDAVSGAAWARGSAAISERLAGLEWFRAAGVVMSFAPMAGEVDVRGAGRVALVAGKVVALPEVGWEAKSLIPRRVESVDAGLVTRRHGVPEPDVGNPEVKVEDLELIVVPGIAFDAAGNRLGRGGGFYDRFLGRRPARAKLVGVALDEQIVGEVPAGPTDIRVDAVVTPTRVLVPIKDDRR